MNVRGKQAEGEVRPEEHTLESRQTATCFLQREGSRYIAPDRGPHDVIHNVELREPLLFLVVEESHRVPCGELRLGKLIKTPWREFKMSMRFWQVRRAEIYGWVDFVGSLPRCPRA